MRILVYFIGNSRAVDQQSVMEMLCKKGHKVFLLTHFPKGDLHRNAEKYGVKAFSAGLKKNNGLSGYIKHTGFLISFVRKNKIDVVFAHLQPAGLIASIARWFVKFKLYYVRHNTDEHLIVRNRNAIFVNRVVNSIAPKIIAPSEKVYKYITEVEKISPGKITRINYGYNFNQYLETDKTGQAKSIRQQFPARLLLVSVARLIPAKRHILMFEAVSTLLKQGYDIELICIGSGPLKETLEDHLTKNNLTEKIFLPGPKTNVFDYLEAADVFLHLSETEASNSAVKEAGYCRKPVIVCPDVGDFSDYVQNGINGFLVKKNDPVPGTVEAILFLYNNPEAIKTMGQKLFDTVTEEFSINKVAGLYEKILEE